MKAHYWGVILFLASTFVRLAPGAELRFAKEGVFLAGILISCWSFGVGAIPKKFSIPFNILSFLVFFNQFHPQIVSVYTQTVMFFCGLLLFATAREFTLTEWRIWERYMVFLVIVHAGWGICNHLGTDPWEWYKFKRILVLADMDLKYSNLMVGPMHQPSMSAASLLGLLPFAGPYLLPIALYALCLYNSSMCYLGLGVGIGYYIWRRKGLKVVGGLAILGTPIALYIFKKFPDLLFAGGRIGAWKAWAHWPMPISYKIHGFGLGYIYSVFGSKTFINGEYFRHLHNEFAEIYAAFGLIGVGCTVWLFMQIKDYKSKYFYAFLMLWINSLGNLTFHLSFTSMIMIFCYARIVHEQGEINA